MAVNENNEKYIAEAWIDDGKDEDFKKSFLQNLLQQMQGHKDDSSGLNADLLDGYHYYDIHKEIVDNTVNLLSEIKIGNVYFNKEHNESYLPFDVIRLNIAGHDFDNPDDANNNELKLPWAVDEGQLDVKVNLNMVFAKLYNMLQEEIDNTYKKEYIDECTDRIEVLEEFNESLTGSGSLNVDGTINASSVNGLRFFVKTQAEYDALSDAIKSNQRNVFIIREPYKEGEVRDEFLLAQQPDTAIISQYYRFAVREKEVVNENGFTVKEKWLQYQHENEAVFDEEDNNIGVWHDVVRTDELVDNDAIVQLLIDAFKSSPNFEINPVSFLNSLESVSINDNSTYPLGNYIRWSGIRGLKLSDDYINNHQEYHNVSFPSDPELGQENDNNYGQPRYVELDDFADRLEDVMENKIKKYLNEIIFPVGCIYSTMSDKNPAEILGLPMSRWEKIEGRFLLGSGTIVERDNPYIYQTGATGGEINHSLSSDEIPSHNHYFEHEHNPGTRKFLYSNADIKAGQSRRKLSDKDKNGYYTVYIDQANAWIGENPIDINGVKGSKNTNNTGGSQGHYNMPPYLVVNLWRRTE